MTDVDLLVEDQREIVSWIKRQNGPLCLAVAFWGRGAIKQLELDTQHDVRILLDLGSGASNPDEVEDLMDLFPDRVKAVQRLHAKAWISSDEVLVGSANASANGLGLEGNESQAWKELGMVSTSQHIVVQAKEWFERLWKDAEPITKAQLEAAREQWKKRRTMRPKDESRGSLLEAAIANPEQFRDRRIYVVCVNAELSKQGEKELAQRNRETDTRCFAYEDWRTIPLDATLIAFTNYKGDDLKADRPALFATAKQIVPGRLQFVYGLKTVMGYSFGSERAWRRRLETLAERHPKQWRSGDICMELLEFVEKTSPSA